MKRIVTISIIASTLLFSANSASNLKHDTVSKIQNDSSITNSTVKQADITISNSSDVDGLTVTQKNGTEAGNLIQGTSVSDSTVRQGSTEISGARVLNLGLDSVSEIKSSNIESSSSVSQSNFIITDSNATDSTADDVNIGASNSIDSSTVNGSDVKQSYTILSNGADVSNLDVNQTNSIETSTIRNSSHITQGMLDVNNSTLNGLSSTYGYSNNTNIIADTTSDGSNIEQNRISLKNGADVKSVKNGSRNEVLNSDIESSNIVQNSISVDNSGVDTMNHYRKNSIDDLSANNSYIIQNRVTIESNSDVKNFTSNRYINNKIKSVTANGSTIAQNDVLILNGIVNGLDIGQENTIEATTTDGTADSNVSQSYISQGKVVLRDTGAINIVEQDANGGDFLQNKIKDIDIEGHSSISQGDLISYESYINNLTAQENNSISSLKMDNGANLTQGQILINGY